MGKVRRNAERFNWGGEVMSILFASPMEIKGGGGIKSVDNR